MPPSVQEEIRQTRPFATAAAEAVVGLFRTADLVRRRLAGAIEPHGLTLQQYNVLRILRGAGESGLPTLEIALRMIEEAPGVTRLVGRLERKQLVARERCPEDRRQVTCRITARGRAQLQALDPIVQNACAESVAPLGVARTRHLIRLLDSVRDPHRGRPAAAPPRRTKT